MTLQQQAVENIGFVEKNSLCYHDEHGNTLSIADDYMGNGDIFYLGYAVYIMRTSRTDRTAVVKIGHDDPSKVILNDGQKIMVPIAYTLAAEYNRLLTLQGETT